MQLASKEIGAVAASLPQRKGLELEASGDSFFQYWKGSSFDLLRVECRWLFCFAIIIAILHVDFALRLNFKRADFGGQTWQKKNCFLFAVGDARLSCRISKGCIRCDVKIVLIVTTFDKAWYLYMCFPYCYVASTSKMNSHSISENMTCWTWLGSVIKSSNMMMCSLFSFCNVLFVKELHENNVLFVKKLHEHIFQDWICNNVQCEGTNDLAGLKTPFTITELNITLH